MEETTVPGRTIFGDSAVIARSYKQHIEQPIDEERYAPSCDCQFPLKRRTIAREVSVSGVGTFEGSSRQTLTLSPSSKPGWWIRRMDQPEQLDTLVDISNLWTSAQNLVLRSGSPHNYLRMVEHIVALKAGLGVDDLILKVNSGDPPLFDDSSLPIVKAIEEAGIVEKDEEATFVTVKEPVVFGGNRGDYLMFLPAKPGQRGLRIDCAISWNTIIGKQRVVFDVNHETFKYASFARTNATHKQYLLALTVGKFFAATRNWGYNKRNILIHGASKYYCPPRFPVGDKYLEPVWHRSCLDLLAALALTGADRFAGTVLSYRAGHTLDCDAVRSLYRKDLIVKID